ncbi:MAG: methionyl-tRNA formyltransferase, partial [Phycisphaerales bacterium JB059]
ARKLSKADAWVDFQAPAPECRNRVHALNPWPGVVVEFAGEPLKVLRAEALPSPPEEEGVSGTFLNAEQGLVHCAPGTALRLIEVQPSGTRAMPWADFARGRTVGQTDRLIGRTGAC